MKNLILNIAIFTIGLVIVSCEDRTFGGTSFYNDYKVENKLDTTITIHLIPHNTMNVELRYTIPVNCSKSIIFTAIGNGEGFSPFDYKSIIVNYKNLILKDTIDEGNSMINIRAYKELEESKYKGKPLNTFCFTIDSTYIKEHLK